MVANFLEAVSAYSKTKTLPQDLLPTTNIKAEGGTSFGDMMQQLAVDTVDQLNKAESISKQGVLGKASPVEIATAVAGAETSLQTLTVLREKVIGAYQEMVRMGI